ncbi:glutathione S-transferase family protein [Mesorhizobium sp. L-8-3]|uniref:glutathione S-transferase family protein n=1 Tax=Mesorhizobium sp. L-8-3 TaxID=2744522 RepID=UPI0019292FE3|nr:glutathione S-transferase family protein [Mesorhizobium sp. L-8-3]BCH21783.1 glutathione S-transferase [Mesorhizobium sp. L-8-3]
MSLTLHFHPLASFCWKALIAFYENGTPFEPVIVDLGDPVCRAAFLKLTPVGKMPVLRDEARDMTVPESTIVIEYLDRLYPGRVRLMPDDPELALQVRLADRFYDFYVHEPMQRFVADYLRPADRRDPYGVDQARAQIESSCAIIDADMATKPWAVGDAFTLADCAAFPALFYADKVSPLRERFPHVRAYLDRLSRRPSVARVLEEAQPYFHLFPVKEA